MLNHRLHHLVQVNSVVGVEYVEVFSFCSGKSFLTPYQFYGCFSLESLALDPVICTL